MRVFAGAILSLVLALAACAGVRQPEIAGPGMPPHAGLIMKRYHLYCLADIDGDERLEAELDRRYGARFDAISSALAIRYGEGAISRPVIDVVGCRRMGAEAGLRRDYESELRAWESELKL